MVVAIQQQQQPVMAANGGVTIPLSAAGQALLVVGAVLIMDAGNGERILAKYYPHSEHGSCGKRQTALERTLFERCGRKHGAEGEATMCDGAVAVCRSNMDLLVFVVGRAMDGNELLLAMALDTIMETLLLLSGKTPLDRRALLDCYDLAALAIDETIDRGIILDVTPSEIAAKVARTPAGFADTPLQEQTLSSAFSFARQRLKSLLK